MYPNRFPMQTDERRPLIERHGEKAHAIMDALDVLLASGHIYKWGIDDDGNVLFKRGYLPLPE